MYKIKDTIYVIIIVRDSKIMNNSNLKKWTNDVINKSNNMLVNLFDYNKQLSMVLSLLVSVCLFKFHIFPLFINMDNTEPIVNTRGADLQ